ncbi:MAG: YggS family pyridoxal phosphate-dependent enzyme [Bacteroidetes bacterium]|nr:YggS family pyridoxal phosphate-dependent enzyme [Bacteroidota bacterium]
MPVDLLKLDNLLIELEPFKAKLVAVSKTKPISDLLEVYNHKHRFFGENYVQELVAKKEALPNDIEWHFIGHLQSNKVKFIAPFVNLIQGVESWNLVQEINRQALKLNSVIDILLQIHIAKEDSKFGFNESELVEAVRQLQQTPLTGIRVRGLMGMASFTDDVTQIRKEFKNLRKLFDTTLLSLNPFYRNDFSILSMGMTSDYKIALEEGSTLIRIGSALFGERD